LIPINTIDANLPNRTQMVSQLGPFWSPLTSCPLDLAVFSGNFTAQY